MSQLAVTPHPPYYAVIFTSKHSTDTSEYAEMAAKMVELAQQQQGFLGMDSAYQDCGITVSYWRDQESISQWKHHAEHTVARRMGRDKWYAQYVLRVAKVEREYSFSNS